MRLASFCVRLAFKLGSSRGSEKPSKDRMPRCAMQAGHGYGGKRRTLAVEDKKSASPALPRSTRQIGAWIETEFGLVYESRSGLVALLHRLGLEYHKPDVIPRKLDVEKQKAFIESYNNLLNSLPDNEAVLFVDA